MKKILQGSLSILFIMCLGATVSFTQTTVSGVVTDQNNVPLIGATVVVKGSSIGTITDLDGNFTLNVSEIPTDIAVSYTGYVTQNIEVNTLGVAPISISLQEGTALDEVVVIGSRGRPRTILGSAVPIDNINAAELRQSGQRTVDQMLNFKVPSYNSSNQTVSDATAHFDPSELRNLGPSRTLVLVNGKRKNQSSLVYVNDTPGKGEVGTDMKSIPAEAIERIEVLRDGAAAQYGSDAIAGVINIILKDRTDCGEITANTGITTQGDGLTYDLGINKGFNVGSGFLNLTGSYYFQDETNRAGEPGGDGLFGVIFGDDAILNGTTPWLQANPDLGMTIGQPEYSKASVLANFGLPYGDGNELYATWGYTRRDGKSFALYRAPYWITDDAGLLTPQGEQYQGFQPTFETGINDITFIAGTKNQLGAWNTDLSFAYGGNTVDYLIGNTINPALLPNSPTEFDAGAYAFDNVIGNLDINRTFGAATLSLGVEARAESFVVEAGQEESYVDGGAQSFPGLQPSNALDEGRSNIGIYGGLDYDLSDNTFIGGALRFENYSDFGSNLSWKVNARQFVADQKGAIRASVSTGFRAPSLHQIYLSNVQTLVSGGTVSNQGTFNNVSDVIRGLGVPALDAETSLNFTVGATMKLSDQFNISADYYNIAVDNRVLFTGEIGFDGDDASTNVVEQILIDNSVTSIKYFVNALDTRTTGFDIVANYGTRKFDGVLSLNINDTSIENDQISSPGAVGDAGYEIFNRKEQSRITSARPGFKTLLGLTYKADAFRVSLNNTYFGEVTWQHASDPSLDQTFGGKIITDLILGFDVGDRFGLNLTVNNLFNVYPDEIETGGDFVTDLGGRFRYPWEVNQFGFLGTVVKAGASYKFCNSSAPRESKSLASSGANKRMDSDGDGIRDSKDMCPNIPGTRKFKGCPMSEADMAAKKAAEEKAAMEAEMAAKKAAEEKAAMAAAEKKRRAEAAAAKKAKEEADAKAAAEAKMKAEEEAKKKTAAEAEAKALAAAEAIKVRNAEVSRRFNASLQGLKFNSSQSTFKQESYVRMDEAVAVLNEYPEINVLIQGHTDAQGDAEKNRALSQRRADAVRDYLVSKGISMTRLSTSGLGEDYPVADNNTAAGRALNRRVEFIIR